MQIVRRFGIGSWGVALATSAVLLAPPGVKGEELLLDDGRQEVEIHDPFERFNRGTFWFNDKLDVFLLEPIATGWTWITPVTVRTHLDQFLYNLRFPVRLVGSLLQAEWKLSAEEFGRFGVNTTVGLAGFFDPATGWGLAGRDEDVGQAFGVWGYGHGFYLVIPILGPSSARDGFGTIFDQGLQMGPYLISPYASYGVGGARLVNSRALALDAVSEAKASSLDYYGFVRHAYLELREAQIRNAEPAEEEGLSDDLYELDLD